LDPRDESEEEQWIQNRQATYQGSFKHFLSVLAGGKNMEEYFRLSTVYSEDNWRRATAYPIPRDWLKIIDMETPLYKKFYFDDYLVVNHWQRGHWETNSIIKFKQDYIVIDTLGNVLTPDRVEIFGEWYKRRVADTLPWEYIPAN
jgi:hypothetical protein